LIRIYYLTCTDDEEARLIYSTLLDKKLIACANYDPVRSGYVWNEEHVEDSETVLRLKSIKNVHEDILSAAKEIHSYEIPCIWWIDAETTPEYHAWVRGEVNVVS